MEQEKKKIKEVAALKYDPMSDTAPKIIALGKGEIAESILKTAKENSVPIVENKDLAHTLNALSIGDEIPPEIYGVVAEILIFIGSVDRDYGNR